MRSLETIFNLDGFSIFCPGDKDTAYIFINPIENFILPKADNLDLERKEKNLSDFNTWLKSYTTPNLIPSIFGYLAYESFQYFEELSLSNFKNILDEYKINDGEFFLYQKTIKVTKDTFEVFINSNSNGLWWELDNEEIAIMSKALQNVFVDSQKKDFTDKDSYYSAITLSESEKFIGNIKSIQNHILDGNVYQANISLKIKLDNFYKKKSEIFLNLVRNEPSKYSSYLNLPNRVATFISNSPELFIKRDGNKIIASPIKGTINAENQSIENQMNLQKLISSSKDLAELAMIVDLFRNDFNKIAILGTLKTGNFPSSITLKHLHHLYCDIGCEIEENLSDIDIIRSSFPSGSISGAPKYTALKLITELEKETRGIYCGGFFAFNTDGFTSSVAIRTITIKDNTCYLRAGCGITIDSTENDELEEAKIKSLALLKELGQFN